MRRDIYIKLENSKEIREIMKEIRKEEAELKKLFERYDKLDKLENKTFENWGSHLEEISQKIEHISL